MEYGEISAYPFYGGRVTQWTAAVDPTAGNDDARELSPQHRDHVLEHDDTASPDWIGTVFEIPEAFDPDAWAQALWWWHRRHEAFRTTAVVNGDQIVRRTFAPEDISITSTDAGVKGSCVEVEQAVLQFFESEINGVHWPHLVTATIVPEDGESDQARGFIVVFGADHAVMDAYAQVLGVTELHELYLAALRSETPKLDLPNTASYADFSHAEAEFARTVELDNDTTRRWHRFLRQDRRFPEFPLPLRPAGVRPSEKPDYQSGLSQWLLNPAQAERFHEHTRNLGYGMQSGVLAAMSLALTRISSTPSMDVVMPMHTRTAGYEESMGWFVGISPVSIDLTGDASYVTMLERATESTQHVKADAQIPFTRTASVLDPQGGPRFAFSYIEFRHARGAEDFGRLRTRLLRSKYAADDEVYLWVLRSHTGMSLSSRFPANDVAAHNVHLFAKVFREVLLQLSSGALHPEFVATRSAAEVPAPRSPMSLVK